VSSTLGRHARSSSNWGARLETARPLAYRGKATAASSSDRRNAEGRCTHGECSRDRRNTAPHYWRWARPEGASHEQQHRAAHPPVGRFLGRRRRQPRLRSCVAAAQAAPARAAFSRPAKRPSEAARLLAGPATIRRRFRQSSRGPKESQGARGRFLRDNGPSTTVPIVAALDSTPNGVRGALGEANVECEDGRYRLADDE
jgi:hypothetical protein